MRERYMLTPDKMDTANTAPAAKSSAAMPLPAKIPSGTIPLIKPGIAAGAPPMIESTVIRMICGVSALKTVFSMENTSAIKNKCAFPRRKWRISPVRLRLTARFSFFKSFSSSLSWNPLFIGFPFSFSKEKSIPEAIRDALKPRFL